MVWWDNNNVSWLFKGARSSPPQEVILFKPAICVLPNSFCSKSIISVVHHSACLSNSIKMIPGWATLTRRFNHDPKSVNSLSIAVGMGGNVSLHLRLLQTNSLVWFNLDFVKALRLSRQTQFFHTFVPGKCKLWWVIKSSTTSPKINYRNQARERE